MNNNLAMAYQPSFGAKVWRYFCRSLRLRCPVCGISPLFMPAKKAESLTDWFTTLPGCPRCKYIYGREPGYFLFVLWLISFGLVSICGLAQLYLLDYLFDLSTPWLMLGTMIPVLAVIILLVRHMKAFYLALDLLIHPHDEV